MKLTLPYPPTTNHLYATVNGRRVKSLEAKRYAMAVASIANKAGAVELAGELVVTFVFYMPRKSDVDNRLKACQDALTGVAWRDDIQIGEIHAYRHIDRLDPRVEVTIEEQNDGDEREVRVQGAGNLYPQTTGADNWRVPERPPAL